MLGAKSVGVTGACDDESGAEGMHGGTRDTVQLEQPDQDERDWNELDEVRMSTHRENQLVVAAVSEGDAGRTANLARLDSEYDREQAE